MAVRATSNHHPSEMSVPSVNHANHVRLCPVHAPSMPVFLDRLAFLGAGALQPAGSELFVSTQRHALVAPAKAAASREPQSRPGVPARLSLCGYDLAPALSPSTSPPGSCVTPLSRRALEVAAACLCLCLCLARQL